MGGGPRRELGLDQICNRLDNVVVDFFVVGSVGLERKNRSVLNALCRKASVTLDGLAVGADEAVSHAC